MYVPTSRADRFRRDADAVEAAVTPRTKAILIGCPANPTGTQLSIILAVRCAGTALTIFIRPFARGAVALAALLGTVFWMAEGFGGIFTGQGTDPSSGPLLILLAACYRTREMSFPLSADPDLR